ncbi:hypothetical protein [Klebsiella pneumoniae]|uniref:hypothetical protein n=1 Tax=Klebsiella pneumoniae TaxID=573 RepID=UPI00346182CE
MCDVGTAALAVTAVAGGLSAYSQIQTGRANAALANANADAQEQAARDTINTANDQAYQQRQQARRVAGQQTTALAANGADLTSGNALDLTTETMQQGTLDALTTINNGQRQAAGLQFQADTSRAQGKIDKQSGMLGAGSTLLNSTLTGLNAYKTLGGTWKPLSAK